MLTKLDGVDVSTYTDLFGSTQVESDLAAGIQVIDVLIVDEDRTIPNRPRRGMKIETFDDAGVVQYFGGRVSELELLDDHPVGLAWLAHCQSHEARLFETSVGSLNYAGVVGWDRDFVIAILRDAMKAQTFGLSAATSDDPIAAANEPSWPGIRATARVLGSDWSYKATNDALDDLRSRVPETYLRIRPSGIVEWFRPRELAPFGLSTTPDGAKKIAFAGYRETEISGGHRNKLRLGGAGAAEETAFDEVSHVRYGRILAEPYVNDENIPAGILRQTAYARLRAKRVRRVATARVKVAGLAAGMLIEVQDARLGPVGMVDPLHPQSWFPDSFLSFPLRSPTGMAKNHRGRKLVQKVSPATLPDGTIEYTLALGDASTPDLPTALSTIAAQAGL